MKLSEEVKNKIIEILDSDYFKNSLYVDANGNELDKTKRDELGQFYTPGKICIKMIEKFKWDTLSGKNILDPTVGSGNLLIACLIAGADSDKIFGNEYDLTDTNIDTNDMFKTIHDYINNDLNRIFYSSIPILSRSHSSIDNYVVFDSLWVKWTIDQYRLG